MSPRLVGGDMPVWSDLDGSHGPGPVRGAALAPLLVTARGRTLVAGPHDPALIDALPAEDLTLLVRGVPDAEALAARYAGRPGVTVCCGGPDKLAESPYDTVVALDGLARLSTVESDAQGWGEAYEMLLGALAPGGTLLLGVENFLGLHRLVALPADATDADWSAAGEYDRTRPAGLARERARLDGAGLELHGAYAAFPGPTAPTALLGARLLADEEFGGFLAAALRLACAPLDTVLTDPGRLAASALRHGAAAELAPAWIVLAHRAGASPAGDLPEAVIAAGPARYEIHGAPGGWTRRHEGEVDAVPSGRTLEELLIGAGLRRDLPAVRELLGAWQTGAAAGVPADQVVVGAGGRMTGLVPSGEPAAALRAFAAGLIREGLAHPWPPAAGAEDLALTLAAMAGREIEPAPAPGPQRERPDAASFREVVAERDRLARELAEARAKAVWYEEMLTSSETALDRTQRIVDLLTATGPARAGRALVGGMRAARRTARAVARSLRPGA